MHRHRTEHIAARVERPPLHQGVGFGPEILRQERTLLRVLVSTFNHFITGLTLSSNNYSNNKSKGMAIWLY